MSASIQQTGHGFETEIEIIEPATCCEKTFAVSVAIFSGLSFAGTAIYSGYNFYCAYSGDEHYIARIVLGAISGTTSIAMGGLSIYTITQAKYSFTKRYIV